MSAAHKNEGTALVLAALPGVFGLLGIGHMYLGRVWRGIVLLVGGLVLAAVGFGTLWFTFGILLIPLVVAWIWSLFDTKNLCRQYNKELDSTGEPPW